MVNRSINKVFVLMLENRSYDNVFGWSDLKGFTPEGAATQADGLVGKPLFTNRDRSGNSHTVGAGAQFQLPFDPAHEFSDVLLALCGANAVSTADCINDTARIAGAYPSPAASANDFGFAACLEDHGFDPALGLRAFTPDQLPVLNFLAQQFAVCDRWFSSMPGPTWPNRFFTLAGTSWGLDHSPSDLSTFASNFLNAARYGNGRDSVLTLLPDDAWMVVDGDSPQSWALAGVERYPQNFVRLADFLPQLAEPGALHPSFIFIEPAYDALSLNHFRNGNSMHPLGDVRRGEMLIRTLYDAIKASPYWEQSAFIILFDEHGGFFDHVVPPTCVPPAAPTGDDLNRHGLRFDRYGFRVPAIVVSPYVRQATIDHTVYDHTSLLKTLNGLLSPQQSLLTTPRVNAANSFERLFTLTVPRHRDDIAPCPSPVPLPADTTETLANVGTARSISAFQTLPTYRGQV